MTKATHRSWNLTGTPTRVTVSIGDKTIELGDLSDAHELTEEDRGEILEQMLAAMADAVSAARRRIGSDRQVARVLAYRDEIEDAVRARGEGGAVRVLRRAAGWTIPELASAIGRHPSTVSRLERGRTKTKTYTTYDVSKALGFGLFGISIALDCISGGGPWTNA